MCKFFKNLFTKDWTMEDKILCVTNAALLGVVVGFAASPIKKGIHIFCHNGNDNGRNSGNNNGCHSNVTDEAKDKKVKKNKEQK